MAAPLTQIHLSEAPPAEGLHEETPFERAYWQQVLEENSELVTPLVSPENIDEDSATRIGKETETRSILNTDDVTQDSGAGAVEGDNVIDIEHPKAVQDRITLLARKYVRGLITEEERARFEIASEKLRVLIPRVRAEELEAITAALEDLREIDARDEERKHRLGLK